MATVLACALAEVLTHSHGHRLTFKTISFGVSLCPRIWPCLLLCPKISMTFKQFTAAGAPESLVLEG